MFNDIVVKDGYMYGGWRRPRNSLIDVKGSIHDDETAQKLGMRGGAVAGANHLDLFAPLLIKAFGKRWFERGSLSIYYTYATRDREKVRAVIGVPPEGVEDVQIEAWLEMPDKHTVGKGTVSVGEPQELSYIQALELKSSESEEPRILSELKTGDELPSCDVMITQEDVDKRLQITTDPLDWYKGGSPWGGSILPPRTMYDALRLRFGEEKIEAVGFYGATELRNVNGPIKVGVPYRASGNIVFVGISSKTEFFWYNSCLDDKDGKRIAELRMMLRFMKASSPLYQDNK